MPCVHSGPGRPPPARWTAATQRPPGRSRPGAAQPGADGAFLPDRRQVSGQQNLYLLGHQPACAARWPGAGASAWPGQAAQAWAAPDARPLHAWSAFACRLQQPAAPGSFQMATAPTRIDVPITATRHHLRLTTIRQASRSPGCSVRTSRRGRPTLPRPRAGPDRRCAGVQPGRYSRMREKGRGRRVRFSGAGGFGFRSGR
jgi:hypothetical protein